MIFIEPHSWIKTHLRLNKAHLLSVHTLIIALLSLTFILYENPLAAKEILLCNIGLLCFDYFFAFLNY